MQLEADHVGHQHRKRLAEHGGLCFDAADAPAENAQPIHHRGMRIGAHQRIRIGRRAAVRRAVANHARQIFEVHLVADARIRRHHLEILQSLLPPAQEFVALDVALEFQFGVECEGHVGAELVHLHRMVDHQFGRQQGIDLLGVAAHVRDGVAHRRQIGHGRHAREVLQAARARA